MPSKRKKSKQIKSKISPSKRLKRASRGAKSTSQKKTVKNKQSAKKKASSKASPVLRKKNPASRAKGSQPSWDGEREASSRQSGESERLSRVEQADSESVDELVEEGNVFEAGAVAGVEEADDQDTREVHTHEVPEDDVPDEYLDKD